MTLDSEWLAELHLHFARHKTRTVLIENRHSGPLRVQKALYPEGGQVCHAVIIHPPGGLAGGDKLSVEINLEANSNVVVLTPAASKWYKAPLLPCSQQTTIRLAKGLPGPPLLLRVNLPCASRPLLAPSWIEGLALGCSWALVG